MWGGSGGMRLTVVSSMRGYAWAGSEWLWQAMALRALSAGHAVHAILHSEMQCAGPVCDLRACGARVDRWRTVPVARLEPLAVRICPNFTWKRLGRPDILVISLGSPTALLAVPGLLPFLEEAGLPYIVVLQFNSEYVFLSPRERDRLGPVMERAHKVVFVSRANMRLLERQLNIDLRGRHELLHNPVLLETEGPLAEPVAEPLRLACVARLETYWKCQDMLLEIFAMSRWRERPCELRLYGRGPDSAYLEERVRRLGLDGRVLMMGHEPDQRKIWAANHALVLPSRGEGTPLAALEAMMCGRPVIATPAGGLSETVVDGLSGYLAEALDTAAMAAALERAHADRRRWSEVGLAGHLQAMALRKVDPAARLLAMVEASGQ